MAGAEELIQNVVLVGGHDQPINRQTHRTGNVTSADVSEVAGGHREAHLLLVVFRHVNPAGDVVHHLRHQTRPVDGVHGTNAVFALEVRISTDGLHHVLAVIKHALKRNVEDVRIIQAEHLRLLEWGHAPSRGEHEHANTISATHRVLGCGTGITAGGTEDIDGLPTPTQLVFKQLTQQLHGHILEGCRRPLGEVTDVEILLQRSHGHDILIRELLRGVRAGSDSLDICLRDVVDK